MELTEERKNTTINQAELSRLWLDLSNLEDVTIEQYHQYTDEARKAGLLDDITFYYEERQGKMKRSIDRTFRLLKYMEERRIDRTSAFFRSTILKMNLAGPLTFHAVLFVTTMRLLATDEQLRYWNPRVENYDDVIGTYAQTELGHGSDVQSLETTAHYDPVTKTFTINSPTITAAKFWPGGLGVVANHAVLQAGTYSNGRYLGIQTFIVPIRDIKSHEPLPGVTVGDIGSKFAFDAVDNGFLLLKNVRVPRDYMLMRYATVNEDGSFTEASPKAKQLAYGGMLNTRLDIVRDAANYLARSATIVTRYSLVRRQFGEGSQEKQILDYQTQQYRVLPVYGAAYTIMLGTKELNDNYNDMMAQIAGGEIPSAKLKEMHVLCSGLKALNTWRANRTLDELKQCAGGHGFLLVSGLGFQHKTYNANVTLEGDNTVMMQQTARFLAKEFGTAVSGQPLKHGSTQFFAQDLGTAVAAYDGLASITRALELRCVNKMKKVLPALASSADQNTAWNEVLQSQIVEFTGYFLEAFQFRAAVKQLDKRTGLSENTRSLVRSMLECFGLNIILTEGLTTFLQNEAVDRRLVPDLQERFRDSLQALRKESIGIVDSFIHSDEELLSAIGCHDGRVYERLLEAIRKNPLNKMHILPGFNEYMRAKL